MSQLIICDLDGTLIDSRADIACAANLALGDLGLAPLPVETVQGYIGGGARRLMARCVAGTDVAVEEALARFRVHYAEHLCDETDFYPGTRDAVRELRDAGFRLAVCSNKPERFCAEIVERLGAGSWFLRVLGGDSAPAMKPDPAPVRMLLELAASPAGAAWMVGDHHADLEAGRRAGVRRCFVSDGIGDPGDEAPDIVCRDFAEFASHLLSEGARV